MEVVSNLRPSKILAQCSTQRPSTFDFRRTLSQITNSYSEQPIKPAMPLHYAEDAQIANSGVKLSR